MDNNETTPYDTGREKKSFAPFFIWFEEVRKKEEETRLLRKAGNPQLVIPNIDILAINKIIEEKEKLNGKS
jgi:hypothetical protein